MTSDFFSCSARLARTFQDTCLSHKEYKSTRNPCQLQSTSSLRRHLNRKCTQLFRKDDEARTVEITLALLEKGETCRLTRPDSRVIALIAAYLLFGGSRHHKKANRVSSRLCVLKFFLASLFFIMFASGLVRDRRDMQRQQALQRLKQAQKCGGRSSPAVTQPKVPFTTGNLKH